MEAHTYAPSPAVARVAEGYWSTSWDLRGQAPHLVEVLTSPSVQLVFEAGASRVVGVTTRLFQRELTGNGLVRAVRLRPGAVRAVLSIPSAAVLTDRSVPLERWVPRHRRLERAVLAGDDQAGFAALEQWLAPRVVAPSSEVLLAVGTIERIRGDREVTTVEQVCRICGLSTRPLQRLFRDTVGVSPKWVIRRERLREAAVELERGGGGRLASLAHALGYADHAHFTRDFKRATGRTPAAFARDVWK